MWAKTSGGDRALQPGTTRQQDVEARSLWRRLEGDGAAVRRNQAMDDRQPEASTGFLRREERLIDPPLNSGWDPRAIVFDGQAHTLVVRLDGHDDTSSGRDRFERIAHEVL